VLAGGPRAKQAGAQNMSPLSLIALECIRIYVSVSRCSVKPQLLTPAERGTYYIRWTRPNGCQILLPNGDLPNDPWFPRIGFGIPGCRARS
jgi:hypothetical protein